MRTLLSQSLEQYPPALLRRGLRRIGIESIGARSALLTALSAGLLIVAGALDRTFFLQGKDIGLFEHPSIWAFLAIQYYLPVAVARLLQNFEELPRWGNQALLPEFISLQVPRILERQRSHLSRKTALGLFTYSILLSVGIAAFAWNTYQNQLPYKYLGFDFWDSIYHPWGYWITRVYKLYLWVVLFPQLAHIQLITMVSLANLLKLGSRTGSIRLEPYNSDRCGGVKKFVEMMIRPLIPALIIVGLESAVVVTVHGRFAATAVFGVSISMASISICYFVPAVILRNLIVREKRRMLFEIATVQNVLFSNILDKPRDRVEGERRLGNIQALTEISRHIRNLPNWPQLGFLSRIVGISLSPTVLGLLADVVPKLIKAMR